MINDDDNSFLKECSAEVLGYIAELRNTIKEQHDKILNLTQMLSAEEARQKTVKCAFTQTEKANEEAKVSDTWDASKSITDIVTQIAQDSCSKTGFVYEPTTGLYYDYSTGYYYNDKAGLYYDGYKGIYYSYDSETGNFVFHSQVYASKNNNESEARNNAEFGGTKSAIKIREKRRRSTQNSTSESEEGECSDSSSVVILEQNVKSPINVDADDDVAWCDRSGSPHNVNVSPRDPVHVLSSEVEIIKEPKMDESAKVWPPCMRLIVTKSSVDSVRVGTLFMITCTGGTLGREGDHHILIPDANISKYHARFDYIEESPQSGNYVMIDLGSRNGTFLNGKRLAPALQESDAHAITHESVITISGTSLACHIHSGSDTCPDCEPGLLLKDKRRNENETSASKTIYQKRMSELRKLKKKFGLEMDNVAPQIGGYEDKAEMRRKKVGSTSDGFKTEAASVHVPIAKTNVGFKMMSKMGWNEGQNLGADDKPEAIKEPILVAQRGDKVGLGFEENPIFEASASEKKKHSIWKKTQKRYQKINLEL